jgi:hypothetical protein
MIGRSKKIKRVGIDWDAIARAGGIPKGPPVVLEKGWKKREFEAALAAAYEVVNKRDGNRSRVTGIELFAEHGSDKSRREHNHLGERSTDPDKITDPSNIFLCSTYEHKFITNHALEIEGTDANKRLIFRWNVAMLNGKQPPFRLLSKRRSQNRTAA